MATRSPSPTRHARGIGRRGLALAVVAMLAIQGWAATPAMAQVSGTPTSAGMPGAALAGKIVNWLMWAALMACLGTICYGAALWRGGTRTGNFAHAADGKSYAAGGAIGALLVGLAVTIVNTLFAAGRAG